MKRYPYDVSVIFPAYNEENNIELCIIVAHAILNELVRSFEIIIVNDGSKDKTKEICMDLENRFKNIRVVSKRDNEGYGVALRDGFSIARYDLVFFSDSDRQFDISNLKDLLEYIDDYEIVIGYRKNRQDSFKRRILSAGFNILVRIIFNIKVKDVDCAFKLFHKKIFDRISIESKRYFVNTEILAKASLLGIKIKQVPVAHFPRYLGESSIGFHDIPRTIKELIRIYNIVKRMKDSL